MVVGQDLRAQHGGNVDDEVVINSQRRRDPRHRAICPGGWARRTEFAPDDPAGHVPQQPRDLQFDGRPRARYGFRSLGQGLARQEQRHVRTVPGGAVHPGQQVVFEINPNYYRDRPKIDKVIWREVPSSATRLQLLLAGSVHIAKELDSRERQQCEGKPGVKVTAITGNEGVIFGLNNQVKPFDNVKVTAGDHLRGPGRRHHRDCIFGSAERSALQGVHAPNPIPPPSRIGRTTRRIWRRRRRCSRKRARDRSPSSSPRMPGGPSTNR